MSVEQRLKLLGLNFYRSPDKEGAGGDDGKDSGGDGKGAEGKDGGPSKGDSSSNGGGKDSLIDLDNPPAKAGERPAFVPETAWDAEKKTIKTDVALSEWEKAHNRAEGLRKELSKAPQLAPKEAKDYKLPEFKEEADKAVKELLKADDPFVQKLTEIAHKHGLSQKQYEGFMAEAGREIAKAQADGGEQKLSEEEINAIKETEMGKIGPNAPRVAAAVSEFLQTKKAQGLFDDDMIAEVKAIGATAAGLKILNAWRSDAGGESITMGDSLTVDGLLSDGEIFGLMGSAAYQNQNDPGHAEMHVKVNKQLTLRQKAGRPERLAV